MYIFLGGGRANFLLGGFPRKNFPWGGKFLGDELVRGNYALWDFARILIRDSFYMSSFLFSVSVLGVELLRVIVQDKFSLGLNCVGDIFCGEGYFSMGVQQDFLALFQNDQKLNKKKTNFSSENKEQH